jgi:hypothetical protein
MRTVTFAVVIVVCTLTGCGGPGANPTAPTSALSVTDTRLAPTDSRPVGATVLRSVSELEAPELFDAAAINLSGIWKGTAEARGIKKAIEFNLKHTGKTIAGNLTKYNNQPLPKGFSATLTLTETLVKGSKRTYKSAFKVIQKGAKCSPTTLTGTLVVDTTKKTMTGTLTGKNTDCIKDTPLLNLKKS